MPGATEIPRGNVLVFSMMALSLTPVSVTNGTSAEQTFTVPGLNVGDVVFIQPPSATAGVGIVGSRVSAANTLAVTWVNASGAPVVPTAGSHIITVLRGTVNPLPTGLE